MNSKMRHACGWFRSPWMLLLARSSIGGMGFVALVAQAAPWAVTSIADSLLSAGEGQAVTSKPRDTSTNDLFFAAIQRDDPAEVERWLTAGTPVTARNPGHCTPLHVAATEGALRSLDLLLIRGAPLEATDMLGYTPLVCAVENRKTAAVRRLLAAGARLQYTNMPPNTPETRERIRQQQEAMTKLARQAHPELFAELFALADELSEPGEQGTFDQEFIERMTTLALEPKEVHAVSHCCDLSTLKLLVEEHGADVNQVDLDQWPLKNFVEARDTAGVAWLLERGALPDSTDTGATALHAAVGQDRLDCARLLLEAGADPDKPDVDGIVALGSVKSQAMLDLMLSFGADPAIGDQAGFKPSHWIKDRQIQSRLRALEKTHGLRGGGYAEALAILDRGLSRSPANPVLSKAKGLLFLKINRASEACEALSQAIEWAGANTNKYAPVLYDAWKNRSEMLRQMGRFLEAGQDYCRMNGYPVRAASVPTNLIDLSLFYNANLDQNWHVAREKGNDLATLPHGRCTLAGIEFDVRGVVQLSSKVLQQQSPWFPNEVKAIPVGVTCQRLHFLQATGWEETEGMQVATCTVHYQDGGNLDIRMVYGQDVRGWWTKKDGKTLPEKTVVAWNGTNGMKASVRLFKNTWKNPRPETAIQSIDYRSNMRRAAPFLVGLTAEP